MNLEDNDDLLKTVHFAIDSYYVLHKKYVFAAICDRALRAPIFLGSFQQSREQINLIRLIFY